MTEFPLNPAGVILDGISLGFYPLARIKGELKECLDAPVAGVSSTALYRLEDFGLTIQEKRFFESIDGVKTLKEVIDSSDLLKQRALALALSFVITGLVRKTGATDEGALTELVKDTEVLAAPFAGHADSQLNAELLFMKAKTALNEREYKAAASILREITDLNPLEGEYWAYLGWAVFNEDRARTKEAEGLIKDSIDLNNDLDAAWFFLGALYKAQGREEEAQKAFALALSKNPLMLGAASELKRFEINKALSLKASEAYRLSYMERFGFLDDPFGAIPPETPATLSAGQEQALGFLTDGLRKMSGPILLMGPDGSGKTFLIPELLKRLSDEKFLFAALLAPQAKELDLIKAINAEVGAASDSGSVKEQLLSFGMRVSQNKIQGGHTLIIIDESDRLSAGCIKLIQYLSRLKTLQIMLVGEPSFLERLSSPEFGELKERLKTVHELKPFTEEETGEYIKSRLEALKTEEVYEFSPDEVRDIHAASGGAPSLVNKKAAERLFASLAKGLQKEERLEEAPPEAAAVLETGEGKAPEEPPVEAFSFEPPFSVDEPLQGPVTRDAVLEEKEAAPVASPLKGEAEETGPPTRPLETEPGLTGNEIAIEGPEAFAPEPARLAPESAATSARAVHKAPAEALKRASPLQKTEEAPFEKPGKSVGRRLTIWIILMIIAGLAIGSAIGIVWLRKDKAGESAPQVVDERSLTPQGPSPIEASAPIDPSASRRIRSSAVSLSEAMAGRGLSGPAHT